MSVDPNPYGLAVLVVLAALSLGWGLYVGIRQTVERRREAWRRFREGEDG